MAIDEQTNVACLSNSISLLKETAMKNHSLGLKFLAFLVAPSYASATEPPPNPIALYHDVIATVAAADIRIIFA